MAKMKRLVEVIRSGESMQEPQRSKHWMEVEQMIEQMTPEDFAVTYDKYVTWGEIPLVKAMYCQMPYLAEMMIRKNPVFAAKIVDNLGKTVLHFACACEYISQDSALKIINLILPYMPQEAILSQTVNKDTFLHIAASRNLYKIPASVPPEIITIILKNSAMLPYAASFNYQTSYVTIVKFLKEAVQTYDIDITLSPQEADNYFKKGMILQGIGKNEKAIKCYQKAVELDHSYANKVHAIKPDALVNQLPISSIKDNPELMKIKITELTQELSELSKKTMILSQELIQLKGSLKITEEHKGQHAAPPSYEEEVHIIAPDLPSSLPPEIVLAGDSDTVLHT